LKLKGANLDPVVYNIVGGETLKDIARNLLGDASLWWRIADANGLSVSGDGRLTPGQTLSVPKLALNTNSAETFHPYDPSQVTGSIDPLLPAPAADKGGCGGIGKIIMIVVAVVVTIYTAGALSGAAGAAFSQTMAAGMATLSGAGTLTGAAAIGAAAVAGAAGSIAS